jgi:hypothetical protein
MFYKGESAAYIQDQRIVLINCMDQLTMMQGTSRGQSIRFAMYIKQILLL